MDVSGARSRLQLLASGRDVLQSIDQLVPSASDRDTLIVRCGRLVEELQAAGACPAAELCVLG